MPTKGMKNMFLPFKTKPSSWPSSSSDEASPTSYSLASTPRRNTQSMIERSIAKADLMVTKWNPNTSGYAQFTSLFQESRKEALDFINCVFNLQKSMHLIGHDDPSGFMVRAQNLMQIAMQRLQKEFYIILSTNRAHLDPESVSARSSRSSSSTCISDTDDNSNITAEVETVPSSEEDSISELEQFSILAMDNLRSVAECMIASGYGKECIKIYNIIRKSIIDEGLYKLGVERISQTQFNKLTWESQDLKIQRWLHAIRIAIKTLFAGERIICDHVFEASEAIRESCFDEISRDGASLLFGFPEIVAKSKNSPEKMFRVLDMYTAIADNWSEIETIFSSDSSSAVHSQALNSLSKLADAARSMLTDFESAVQNDTSKLTTGGGVDPLTIYVMNNLSSLSDYAAVLNKILSHHPLPVKSSSPESLETCRVAEATLSAFSIHAAWLILFLHRKIDERSTRYGVVSTSHLFRANNLHHILSTVHTSNLKHVLGEKWIQKQDKKLNQYVASYASAAWGGVRDSLPPSTTAKISATEAKETFKKFTARFEEAYRKQSACVVPDQKLRNEMKDLVMRKIVPRYREFFKTNKVRAGGNAREGSLRMAVRFTPEDVANHLSDLYFDDGDSDSGSSSSSSLSFPSPSPSLSSLKDFIQTK